MNGTRTETASITFFLAALFIALPPGHLRAQEITGTIVGVVSDSSGGVLPGAAITVTGAAIQAPRSVVTESNGTYRVTLLPPGTYSISYGLDGFAQLTRENVTVSVGRTLTLNVSLQLASLADAVRR
jgi:hypothetical protein